MAFEAAIEIRGKSSLGHLPRLVKPSSSSDRARVHSSDRAPKCGDGRNGTRSVSVLGPLPFRTANIRFAFNRFDTGHVITIAH